MMRTGQPTEGEWRVVWPDGSVHWIAGRGQVFMDDYGEPSRMLGVNIDITKRKQAEEALSNMTRKLVEAQDQERARIARELHDDINQRLAMLAVELGQAEQNHPDLPPRHFELHARVATANDADISRRSSLVTRSALLTTGISGCRCGHERLVQGIWCAAGDADRL